MGTEEIDTLFVLDRLRREGMTLKALPPNSSSPKISTMADAVLACNHDRRAPSAQTQWVCGNAVNITLGLPYSHPVDHGRLGWTAAGRPMSGSCRVRAGNRIRHDRR